MSRALVFAALLRSAAALLVAQGSPCETKCGNVLDSTTDDMVVCDESAYSTTSSGQVFEACVGCETSSSYSASQDKQGSSDLGSMLYNMRYATNMCLYEANTTPCITSFACANIKNAIEYGNLSTSGSTYDYCNMWTEYNLDKCHECLESANEHYLSNYISILDGACRLRLEPPATLPLQGRVFSTDIVNVTDPTPTATFSPPSGPAGPLDSGAIAGVAVGGFAVLLALVGCGVVLNGKRRRRAYLRRREEQVGTTHRNWPQAGGNGGGDMFETPVSQRPLRGAGWEDSPVSAATAFPPYFSPYASQYNSPVSAVESAGPHAWPSEKIGQNIGVAISPDREFAASASPWGDEGKGKEKAASFSHGGDANGFELQEGVGSPGGYGFPIPPPPPLLPNHAPMLGHPGYGRHGPPRPEEGDVPPGGAL
ncbi:hypothetical protein GGR52DRAFT_79464 [Hypoxylon sp. FL1284]|nr:hypothetical protein GGR52DRAFT_79464 [Hypoxylon sp. FL1284]